MDTNTRSTLIRLAWDTLLPIAAEKLDDAEYRLLALAHVLSAAPDDLDAGQILLLVDLLVQLGAI